MASAYRHWPFLFYGCPCYRHRQWYRFIVSELIDWAIYTFTQKPLSQRIFYSSLVAAPIDTAIFFYGAEMVVSGIFSVGTVVAAVLSKLAAAIFVAWLVKRREDAEDNSQKTIVT